MFSDLNCYVLCFGFEGFRRSIVLGLQSLQLWDVYTVRDVGVQDTFLHIDHVPIDVDLEVGRQLTAFVFSAGSGSVMKGSFGEVDSFVSVRLLQVRQKGSRVVVLEVDLLRLVLHPRYLLHPPCDIAESVSLCRMCSCGFGKDVDLILLNGVFGRGGPLCELTVLFAKADP